MRRHMQRRSAAAVAQIGFFSLGQARANFGGVAARGGGQQYWLRSLSPGATWAFALKAATEHAVDRQATAMEANMLRQTIR